MNTVSELAETPAGVQCPDRLTRVEWAVCLGATVAAIGLHILFLTHAGGMWRDEVTTARVATAPTLGEMWRMLAYESFPALFHSLLRGWCAIGLGSSDFGLRCLGFVVGIGLLAVIWLSARVLRSSLPFVSLALLASNLTLVRTGDAIRAYGLGCILIVLTFIQVWRLMKAPGVGSFLAAALGAALSVQCLYQNSFLLFAICVAGCYVAFRCEQERTGFFVIGVGVVGAVSLLPYAGIMLASQKSFVVARVGASGEMVWSKLCDALGDPMIWQVVVWLGLLVLAVSRGIWFVPPAGNRQRIGPQDLPSFGAITLGFSVLCFVLFIFITRLPTQPWYWLPLMALGAVCMDAVLGDWLGRSRGWRLGLLGVMAFLPMITGIRLASYRQTNIDVIARRLKQQAKADDLILVHPWYCGVTFNWYYRGAAPWVTLPALSDFRVGRYDLLRERLAATSPIKPVLDRIGRTLAGGNQVWIVGDLPLPQPDETGPPDLPPAPNGPQGWFDVPYSHVWGRQADYFIAAQGGRAEAAATGTSDAVNPYEKASLTLIKGWGLR